MNHSISTSAKHKFPIGSLVEVSFPEGSSHGVRLFVADHTVNLHGEPLYVLTWDYDLVDKISTLKSMMESGDYVNHDITKDKLKRFTNSYSENILELVG